MYSGPHGDRKNFFVFFFNGCHDLKNIPSKYVCIRHDNLLMITTSYFTCNDVNFNIKRYLDHDFTVISIIINPSFIELVTFLRTSPHKSTYYITPESYFNICKLLPFIIYNQKYWIHNLDIKYTYIITLHITPNYDTLLGITISRINCYKSNNHTIHRIHLLLKYL